jgi:sulfur-carrier protein
MSSDVTVRYWAGARRAAGRAEESVAAASLGELRALLLARSELAAIVRVSSFLVNAEQASDTTPLAAGAVVDVLPPFAGGAAT